MIQNFKKSQGMKKSMVALFVLCAFLFPVSVSLTTNPNASSLISSMSVQVEMNTTYAAVGWIAGKFFDMTVGTIIDVVGYLLLATASLTTQFGGMLLDGSLKYTVFEMGNMINSQKLGNTIDTLWSVIRDICNLAFIFGFIYVGIRTIIDPDSANTKRFLSRIIIGALLINFSLFFVKIIVDFSNFTALQIYSAMMQGSSTKISEVVFNILGVVTLFTVVDPDILANATGGKSLWFYLFGSFFLLITAFVFFAGAILFIIRFVSLIFIMIASPVLFAATIFPQTEKYASDLWKKLMNYAIFAPAYLLLMLISITVLQSLELRTINSSFTDGLFKMSETGFVVFINFAIAIGFMVGSLIIATRLGTAGGDITIKMAGAATFGLAARASRATIGRYAHNISEREELKDKASQKGWRGTLARGALKTTRTVGDSSFDARNTGALSKKLGIGEGRKGGYKTVLGEIEEKETKFAKSLGEVSDDDARVKRYKDAATKAEDTIKNLKEERTGLSNSPEDIDRKKEIIEQIRRAEKTQKESNEKYNQEKQRRVLGSTYTQAGKEDRMKETKNTLDRAEKDLADTWEDYEKETDKDAKEIILGALHELQVKVNKARADHKTEQAGGTNKDGYANVLKSSTLFNSWPFGRLASQEIEVGKAIERAFTKKIKKTKEDARTDTLVEAVKSSKS